jgi:predicted MFS family arabinose efflux permease
MATYMPSTLTDRHLPASTGAAVLAVIGFANIIGTYACGVLGGRFPKNLVLACIYLARACAIAAFIAAPVSVPSALVFAAIMGLTWTGTVPLTGSLVGDIFGQRHIGLLFGIVYFTHQLGGFFGAWAGGFVFDRTGSYTPVWIGAVVFSVLAAIIHWPIRDEPAVRPLALQGLDA